MKTRSAISHGSRVGVANAVFAATALLLIVLRAGAALPDPNDPTEQIRRMRRGVNILGYDLFWKDTSLARFKSEHFTRIRRGGFETVRVNLHAFRHMNAENQLPPDWFSKLDWIVDQALKNDLIVILDEHDFQAIGNDLATNRPKLLAFWTQVAERYSGRPNSVLFEILNEPNGKVTKEAWNSLFREALAIIRQKNPDRNVVIGPPAWNNVNHLTDLLLPEEDRHIIVTIHYYLPFRFTHQGASWSPSTKDLSGIKWGTDNDRKQIETDFDKAQRWAKKTQRPILLGEFGAYDKADLESRVKYTAHVARTAEKMGWAWTYWQFDGDFVVFEIPKNDWNMPIYKALVP